MNYNIHCKKTEIEKNIQEFLEEGPFKIREIQTYYPIMDHYYFFSLKNLDYNKLEFRNRYKINKIIQNNKGVSYDFRTDKIYQGLIYDFFKRKQFKRDIFFKINSILNPISYIMDKYSIEKNTILPFYKKYHMKRINKVLNKNNSAYIDSFCTFICGKMVDNNLCPNFPKYFGSYCGVMNSYWFDMSDEYEIYSEKDWFQKYLNEGKFEIHRVNKSDLSNIKNSLFNINKEIFLDKNNLINKEFINKLDSLDLKSNFDIKNSSLFKDDSLDNDESHNDIIHLGANGSISDTEIMSNSENESDIRDNDSMNEIIIEDTNLGSEYNLIDSISDLSCTSVSNNSISCEPELIIYGIIKNIPVNAIITECLEGTLEQILSQDKQELDTDSFLDVYKTEQFKKIEFRWKSYMWQISFALAIAQKYIKFTHNDLHSNNIMYSKTNLKYLFYHFNNKYYRVPTNGFILKIIDFGRAVFKLNNKIYFSDVFEFDGDAGEQYSYPFEETKMDEVYPNMSFDLSRLSSSIFDDLFPFPPNTYEDQSEPQDENSLYSLLLSWITDKNGNLVTRFDDFNLYKNIARDVDSAVPKEQLGKDIFKIFEIDKDKIRSGENIYKY